MSSPCKVSTRNHSLPKISLVRLLGKRVELGNSVVKGLLGEVASTIRAIEDLVATDQYASFESYK